ncbi:MAG: hypothetical protein GWP08_09735 [Nitrospiraceae bacterium]|nr:hypothetical protein [Nitrospiraceae bacterium]
MLSGVKNPAPIPIQHFTHVLPSFALVGGDAYSSGMGLSAKRDLWDCTRACLLWLGLGFGLGWYYAFTHYDRSWWPMPLPEGAAPLILYYFSVLNVRPELQVVHWLAMFPVAGFLWVWVLTVTAPYYGGRRVDYAYTALRFSVTSLPVALVGPAMAFVAAGGPGGLDWNQMTGVALRQAHVVPWSWLTPLYAGLAGVALIWQIVLYVKVFDLHGKKAWAHFLSSVVTLGVLACGLATLAAIPLLWSLQ